MGKCKTKSIQTGLGTFRHNQAYPGIIQTYSRIFRTLKLLEPWYIHNPDIIRIKSIFRTLVIFTTLVYSEPLYIQRWHIQNSRHIQKC